MPAHAAGMAPEGEGSRGKGKALRVIGALAAPSNLRAQGVLHITLLPHVTGAKKNISPS